MADDVVASVRKNSRLDAKKVAHTALAKTMNPTLGTGAGIKDKAKPKLRMEGKGKTVMMTIVTATDITTMTDANAITLVAVETTVASHAMTGTMKRDGTMQTVVATSGSYSFVWLTTSWFLLVSNPRTTTRFGWSTDTSFRLHIRTSTRIDPGIRKPDRSTCTAQTLTVEPTTFWYADTIRRIKARPCGGTEATTTTTTTITAID
jgi:hypothetical protein